MRSMKAWAACSAFVFLSSHALACPAFEERYGQRTPVEGSLTQNMDGCDFRNAYLGGRLSGLSFKGADFTGAKIQATLTGSDFTGANFTRAELDWDVSKTIFDGADFTDARLTRTVSDSRFRNARFHRTSFAGTAIERDDFTDADFTGAQFRTGYGNNQRYTYRLRDSDFTRANFTSASFYFEGDAPVFTGLVLDGATFTGAVAWPRSNDAYHPPAAVDPATPFYQLARQRGAIVTLEDLAALLKDPARLQATGAELPRTVAGLDLSGADLRHAARFAGNCTAMRYRCDLSGVNFSHADLEGLSFYGTMDGADFSHANLHNTYLGGSMRNANFRGAILARTQLDAHDLENADFSGATVSDVTLNPLCKNTGSIIGIKAEDLSEAFTSSTSRDVRQRAFLRELKRDVRTLLFHPAAAAVLFVLAIVLYRRTRRLAPSGRAGRILRSVRQGHLILAGLLYARAVFFQTGIVFYKDPSAALFLLLVAALPVLGTITLSRLVYALVKRNRQTLVAVCYEIVVWVVAFLFLYGTPTYVP